MLFLDETWVNVGYATSKTWSDTTVKNKYQARRRGLTTGGQHPSGLGKRLIILHVGNENGFHPDGCLVFESNKGKDYHKDMDSNVFESWFEAIVKEVPTGTVFVMDNASYHSRVMNKVPTTRDRKDVILQWLHEHNVNVPSKTLKVELLELVKENKPARKYYVDEIAKAAGCSILRLPPYHAELNPIELVWAQVKEYIRSRNTQYTLANLKRLLEEAVNHITPSIWAKCVQHVEEKVEPEMWQMDEFVEMAVEPMIIDLSTSDEESDNGEW
jgi:transposase